MRRQMQFVWDYGRRCARLAAVICLLVWSAGAPAWAADFTWTNSPLNSDWNNFANWDGPASQYPDGSNDSALISGVPANGIDPILNINQVIQNLVLEDGGDMSTGTRWLDVTNQVRIEDAGSRLTVPNQIGATNLTANSLGVFDFGTLDLQGGDVEVRAGSITNFGQVTGFGTLTLDSPGASLFNEGQLQAEGGTFTVRPSATNVGVFNWDGNDTGEARLQVSSGAMLDIQISQNADRFDGQILVDRDGTLNNAFNWESNFGSQITLNGVTGTAAITGGDLATFGDVNVNSGIGYFNTFWHGRIGNVRVGPLATLRMRDALLDDNDGFTEVTFDFGDESTMQVDGDVTINRQNSSLDWDGSADTANTVVNGSLFTSGLTINADAIADPHDGNIRLNNGKLAVNVLGDWVLGGTLTLNDNTTGLLTSKPALSGSPVRVEGGTIHVSGGGIVTRTGNINSQVTLGAGGGLTVPNPAVLNMNGPLRTLTSHGSFDVDGTLNLNNAGVPHVFNDTNLTGNGRVNLVGDMTVNGNVVLDPKLVVTGQATIPSTRSLQVNGSATVDGGTIQVSGGKLTGNDLTNDGTVRGRGTVAMGGAFVNNGTIEADPGTLVFDGSGSIDLDGASGTGVINAVDGDVRIAQGIGSVNFAGELNTRDHTFQVDAGGIFNDGTFNLNGGTFRAFDVVQASRLSVGPDFDAEIDALATFRTASINDLATTLTLARDAEVQAGASFTGGGTLRVGAGTTARLHDGANINVTVLNEGRIEPGNSPGAATVAAFKAAPNSGLVIEIGGVAPAMEYDRLVVNGAASLDGSLDVSLVDLGNGTFEPIGGDTFEIITASSISGSFDTPAAQLPALGPELEWFIDYNPINVVLEVMADYLVGDMNDDGLVNFGDLSPFTAALTDPVAYQSMFPTLNRVGRCDVSGDRLCNFGDLTVFGNLLVGAGSAAGSAAQTGVPEPASLALVLLATGVLLCGRGGGGQRC